MTSLKRKLSALAKQQALVDPSLVELAATTATPAPAIALLVEQAQQHDLLSSTGAAKLKRLDAIQQTCSQAAAAPPLADFVADAFAVVDSMLGRAGGLECGSGLEQALVLSRAITAVVATLKQHLATSQTVPPRSLSTATLI